MAAPATGALLDSTVLLATAEMRQLRLFNGRDS